MKLIKTVRMDREEVEAFLKKCLTKYIEGKTKNKVADIELEDYGALIRLEEEELNDE